MAKYSHQEFKKKARDHQVNFKTSKDGLNINADRCPKRKYKGEELPDGIKSSLLMVDYRDKDKNFIIFFEGIRKEISDEINSREFSPYSQMVTNLLRSEHILSISFSL